MAGIRGVALRHAGAWMRHSDSFLKGIHHVHCQCIDLHLKYANARCGGIPCRCDIAGVCLVEGGFCDCVGRDFIR